MPSKSKAQRNLMAAAAHSPALAKKVGVPVSVAKEFNQADKGKKFGKGGETMKHSDVKMDKKVVKKAVGMHEKQLHGGKKSNLTSLKKGGKVMKFAEGGQIGPKFATDETVRAEVKQRLDEEPYKSRVTAMKKEISDSKEKSKKALAPFNMKKGGCVKMAKGGGIEVRGKTRGKMC
jgi:hypothetical protein